MPVYKDDKRNTWYYSIYYTDIYGKGKRKVKRGFRTKKSARIAESEMLKELKRNHTDKTFDAVFHDRLKHAGLTQRTKENRINQYELHIKREFGRLPINEITIEQCQDFRQRLVNNAELSNGTKVNILSGFKSVFNYGEKYLNTNNPTRSIDNFKTTKSTTKYIKREDFDNKVYQMDKLNNTKPKIYRQFVQLLFYSGLRVSEAMPLTWQDFDKDAQTLDINKTMVITNREIRHGVAKNSNSLGTVHVAKKVVSIIEEVRKEANPDDVYIFGGNKPLSYEATRVNFKKVFKDDGLTLHSLRHSYASHLINNSVDIYVLMHLMRHANVKQTIQTYSHLYNDTKLDALKLFDD
ncbi:site-specific integrase [Staphylococcus equorum]|uniref:site-specific integrase n=1 Tax=Staphylococcus equorum TaxID=246432 RepID=UPI0039801C29